MRTDGPTDAREEEEKERSAASVRPSFRLLCSAGDCEMEKGLRRKRSRRRRSKDGRKADVRAGEEEQGWVAAMRRPTTPATYEGRVSVSEARSAALQLGPATANADGRRQRKRERRRQRRSGWGWPPNATHRPEEARLARFRRRPRPVRPSVAGGSRGGRGWQASAGRASGQGTSHPDQSKRKREKSEKPRKKKAGAGRSSTLPPSMTGGRGKRRRRAVVGQTAGQLGSGARYRFALKKEDLIEGSKQGWQLNTNSKGLAGWLAGCSLFSMMMMIMHKGNPSFPTAA